MKRVYFIRAACPQGLIKIGASVCPEARFLEISANSPVSLELLGSTPNIENLEYRLHGFLAADRAHAEWFRPSADMLAVVASILDDSFDHEVFPRTYINNASRGVRSKGAQRLRAETPFRPSLT